MWKYLGFLAFLAGARCMAHLTGSHPLPCEGGPRCLRSIPPRVLAPESLLHRRRRQQQIVQEVIVENNFSGPGFGGPGFGGPGLGRPSFGGPGFGGPGFGGPGFGGPGFGGPEFGGPSFGRPGFARSYDQADIHKPSEEPNQYNALEVTSPACPKNYVFSCEALIKSVPCRSSSWGRA
ncbi:hypothetical protein KR084_004705 [Drosophila pseudotakahashii]|nr:hypothetical protein KR084_004705 [Drosophila pseudotakahashii]